VQDRSYHPYPPLFAAEYAEKLSHCCNFTSSTQLNLLAGHDTARLISIAGGDRASVELATLLLLTLFIMVMKLAYLVV